MKICLIDETGAGDGALSVLAARWGLEHDMPTELSVALPSVPLPSVTMLVRSTQLVLIQ